MTKPIINCFFAAFAFFVVYGCTTYEWKPKDMNSRVGSVVEADLNPHFPFCGFVGQCKFDLYYFYGPGFTDEDLRRKNSKPNDQDPRKNILYIPGGPGDIVNREAQSLYALRHQDNVVYFDIRGTGFSSIPESNAYDQFLRARYVMEDIEVLRKELFNACSEGEIPIDNHCNREPNPWDAIYAHSWGTIVAQQYAKQYPKMVRKLILSAPVSRVVKETESARRQQIIANLINIYEKHALTNCDWTSNSNSLFVQEEVVDVGKAQELDDFCFVRNKQKEAIASSLSTLLYLIEEDYGSISFVQSFYSQLWNKDPNFRGRYHYPEEFFNALRQLEELGAGDQYPLQFDRETTKTKINAAFFLGFYSMLPADIRSNLAASNFPRRKSCTPDTPFLDALPSENGNHVRNNLCLRIGLAWDRLETERSHNRSLRARSVFSVFDGLNRWIFGMMKRHQRLKEDTCFMGEDLRGVANGDLKTNLVMQEEAAKLGLAKYEKICPWDPELYRHQVPTLILAGDADSVTAGGQAEHFYNCGLTPGERVYIEFPGVGHNMVLQANASREEVQVEGAKSIARLVFFFLRRTPAVFRTSSEVQKTIKALNASLKPDIGAGPCKGSGIPVRY